LGTSAVKMRKQRFSDFILLFILYLTFRSWSKLETGVHFSPLIFMVDVSIYVFQFQDQPSVWEARKFLSFSL
jgi:hypothetical protein